MKRRKYRKLLKQIRKRVFRVTVPALDENEVHLEEMSVVAYSDIIEILWKNMRGNKHE